MKNKRTISDIAKAAGVSKTTVPFVIDNDIILSNEIYPGLTTVAIGKD